MNSSQLGEAGDPRRKKRRWAQGGLPTELACCGHLFFFLGRTGRNAQQDRPGGGWVSCAQGPLQADIGRPGCKRRTRTGVPRRSKVETPGGPRRGSPVPRDEAVGLREIRSWTRVAPDSRSHRMHMWCGRERHWLTPTIWTVGNWPANERGKRARVSTAAVRGAGTQYRPGAARPFEGSTSWARRSKPLSAANPEGHRAQRRCPVLGPTW